MNDNIIKMFIGGEEVVSSKEFTISEEMLSASSTILNNCYPASWEETKDYVSNFYYPKDYSKFILGKGNFTYGTEQYTILNVSGNNFMQFTTNIEREYAGLKVYGNTYQETRTSKNLIPFTNQDFTLNSIHYYINKGSLYFNGTSTSETSSLNVNFKNNFNFTLPSGTYTISHKIGIMACYLYNYDNNTLIINLATNTASQTFTLNATTKVFIGFYVYQRIFDNVNSEIMISKNGGTYEPFVYDMPSPQAPSELVSVGYTNYFNKNDVTLNTTINASGQPAYNAGSVLSNFISVLSNTNYYLSSVRGGYYVRTCGLYDENKNFIQAITISGRENVKGLITTTEKTQYIRVVSGTNYYNNCQVIKSSIELPYVDYGKYGIQIKNIGKNFLGFPNSLYSDDTYDEDNVVVTISLNRIWLSGKLNPISAGQRSFAFLGTSSNTFFANYGSYFSSPNTITLSAGTYTLSLQNRQGYINSTWIRFYVFKNTPTTPHTQIINLNLLNEFSKSFTLTEETDVYFTLDYKNNTEFLFFFNLQLEKSSVETPYEEHKENSQLYLLNEPLRAIGDTKDLLYIDNGKLYVERKIGELTLDGTNKTVSVTDKTNYVVGYYYSNEIKKLANNSEYGTMSDKLKAENVVNAYNGYVINSIAQGGNGKYLLICLNRTYGTNTSAINTWLQSNNVTAQYLLAEPYIEEVGAVELPTAYNEVNNTTFYTGLNTDEEIGYYWKNFDVLFAGIVKNSGDVSLRPTDPKYCSLQILDYKTFLSECDTLDFVISEKTIAEAISMVVEAISDYGFILGNINISQKDDWIGAYSTLNKVPYDVLQYLANISGSRWRARFVDDSTMAIDFYDPDTLPKGKTIQYTQSFWENNKIVDLTFNYGTRDYRNKQVMLSDEVYGSIDYTDTILSNGYDTTFVLTEKAAIVRGISVNNILMSVATNEQKEMGIDADFYYTPGNNVVEGANTYTAGTQIIVTYTPLVKGRQIVYNNDEIDRISSQTGTKGIIARYESRNDVLSSDELDQIGQSYIKYKGTPEIILKLTTQDIDIYNIGEVAYFDAPIKDLQKDYMVKSKQTEYIVVNDEMHLFYTYEMTSSFNSEKEINWFDNQRNKAKGNISAGESITRNIDIENTANIIWDNLKITEIAIVGDNTLNSVLNSPFIN